MRFDNACFASLPSKMQTKQELKKNIFASLLESKKTLSKMTLDIYHSDVGF